MPLQDHTEGRRPGNAPMQEIRTLVELLETTCVQNADRPALGQKRGSQFEWITFAQLRRHVARAKGLLTDWQIEPADRVAIIADNCVEWAVLCYATAACGAVFVPMYAAQPASEWSYILRDCGAKICFCGTTEIFQRVTAIRSSLPVLDTVVCLADSANREASLKTRLAECENAEQEFLHPDPLQIAAIIYTSGTTGDPKGVILSHHNITSNALAGASLFPIDSRDRALSILPWAHAFGQTVDLHLLLGRGVAVAINDDVASLLSNLAMAQPTVLVAVPRVFNRIHDNVRKQIRRRSKPTQMLFHAGLLAVTRRARGQSNSLPSRLALMLADRVLFSRVRDRLGGKLRFAICGSAALGREVAEFVNALGIDLYEGYGLTEASPVVSVNTPTSRRFGTVGRPLPGTQVTIDRSQTGDPRHGEILVTGPNVMQGYYNLPAETAAVIGSDGALRTGDMGYVDSDGYLVITGRLKEQYKLENGKYVVPSPLEERLRLSPLIANCILYGANRPHNVVLVVPDWDALRQHASDANDEPPQGTADPRIARWILKEIRDLSRGFRSFERPKRVALCEEDFTIANGLLTPTLKPRRDEIVRRHQAQLDALYAGTSRRLRRP